MPACLPHRFWLVVSQCSSKERKGSLCCLLGKEMRYVHNDSSHTSSPSWHPQYTAHRNAVSLCKEKWKFCWEQEAAIPSLAFPASCHACHGYGCTPTRARMCDWSTLEQDFLHPISDTGQFKSIEDWGLRNALRSWAFAFSSLFKGPLGLKTCIDSLQPPTQGASCSSRSYKASSVKKYRFREGFEIYFPPVYCFPTNVFNLWYWCGWISLPYACASLASHSSNLRKIFCPNNINSEPLWFF